MSRIFLVDLESVQSRYTGEWKEHIPRLLKEHNHDVEVISGLDDIPAATTPGAFLNFGGTNIYKAAQVERMGRLFCDGAVRSGDHFIFTDFWHPGIINLKYMSELLGVPVKIHALLHAGSWDPQDFLGRLIGPAPWVRYAEKSFYEAVDHNYFATQFHIDMFETNLYETWGTDGEHWLDRQLLNRKIIRTGWPMEYMQDTLAPYKNFEKRNLILFPHRIAPEKQVEIFRDLARELPEFEFVVCQDQELTKKQYHTLLGQAKIVFSANLQETLGISTCCEGPLLNAVPLAPDRLSYSEVFKNYRDFLYPSEWTQNWPSYLQNKQLLADKIKNVMHDYDQIVPKVKAYVESDYKRYFHADKLLENLA